MPSKIFQPPYTGVAVVQYFAYKWANGQTKGATEQEVRAILDEALALYVQAHPVRGYAVGGLQFQRPSDRGHMSQLTLRVIPDVSR